MSITKMLAGLSKAKMMKGSGNDMLNSSNAMGLAASLLSSKRKKSKFLGKEIIDKFINNSNLKRRYN